MGPDSVVAKENESVGNAERKIANDIKPQETRAEKLQRLQTEQMTKLGNINRQYNSELTSSPHALSLARKTFTPEQSIEIPPKSSVTTIIVSSTPANARLHEKPRISDLPEPPPVEAAVDHSRQPPIARPLKPPPLSRTVEGRRGGRGGGGRRRGRGKGLLSGSQGHSSKRDGIKNEVTKTEATKTKATKNEATKNEATKNEATKNEATKAEDQTFIPRRTRSVDSNAETTSGDSVAVIDDGSPVRNNKPAISETHVVDANGDSMSPLGERGKRPRLNGSFSAYMADSRHWNDINTAQLLNEATGVSFTTISVELVKDITLHPDGLDLVDPTISIDLDTAERYGYIGDDMKDIIAHDARLIDPGIFTDDWGKLDLRDPENARYKDERLGDLVRGYNANIARERQEEINDQRAHKQARNKQRSGARRPNPHTPQINIYLRPAIETDLDQLLDIYNFWVMNSFRTSEYQAISAGDMQERWLASTDEKLPFLVAVSKSAVIHRGAGDAVEKVVGWASATDWVNRNSVERYTVELEIYVHQEHLHQGVGKCLMDKMMDSTDRGHIARGGFRFSCAPERNHAYSAGGDRNLMKLIIMVRTLDKPKRRGEDDFPFIKKWLEEQWKFEQQGLIKKVGVKFKRYINHVYFVRSTAFNPAENAIPDGVR